MELVPSDWSSKWNCLVKPRRLVAQQSFVESSFISSVKFQVYTISCFSLLEPFSFQTASSFTKWFKVKEKC